MNIVKAITLAAVALTLTGVAHADPVTVTMDEARALATSLIALDGYDQVVREGDKDRVVKQQYKFSGPTLMKIARDRQALVGVLQAFDEARAKAVRATFGETKVDESSAEARDFFEKQMKPMLAEKQTLDLARLKQADLKLGDPNAIPPGVVQGLFPILDAD